MFVIRSLVCLVDGEEVNRMCKAAMGNKKNWKKKIDALKNLLSDCYDSSFENLIQAELNSGTVEAATAVISDDIIGVAVFEKLKDSTFILLVAVAPEQRNATLLEQLLNGIREMRGVSKTIHYQTMRSSITHVILSSLQFKESRDPDSVLGSSQSQFRILDKIGRAHV